MGLKLLSRRISRKLPFWWTNPMAIYVANRRKDRSYMANCHYRRWATLCLQIWAVSILTSIFSCNRRQRLFSEGRKTLILGHLSPIADKKRRSVKSCLTLPALQTKSSQRSLLKINMKRFATIRWDTQAFKQKTEMYNLHWHVWESVIF